MITKKQLLELEKPSHKNNELHYRPGGDIEAAVHSSVEAERIGQLNRGHQMMNEAVEHFRNNMAFKTREGLARSQFQSSVNSELPPVDTDLGYGAGRDYATVDRYVNHALKQRPAICELSVRDFAENMRSPPTQDQTLDR